MPPIIVLFAKAPIPGRVKSRLIPVLGPERATTLHRALVWDQILLLKSLAGAVRIELHTDDPTDAWTPAGVSQKIQVSGDLGSRMLAALNAALETGAPQACVIGGDIPCLPASHVTGLLGREEDAAFGPAEDGGFWGIAARRVHPAMFRGVSWASRDTLAESVRAARQCGLSTGLAGLWWDVDTAADVRRLYSLPNPSPHLAEWLNSGGGWRD